MSSLLRFTLGFIGLITLFETVHYLTGTAMAGKLPETGDFLSQTSVVPFRPYILVKFKD